MVSRAVGDPALISLLPAPRVALGVAQLVAGLVGDAQGALALGVGAFGVVVLRLRFAGLLPLALPLGLLKFGLALAEVGFLLAGMEERVSPVALSALGAGAEPELGLE